MFKKELFFRIRHSVSHSKKLFLVLSLIFETGPINSLTPTPIFNTNIIKFVGAVHLQNI